MVCKRVAEESFHRPKKRMRTNQSPSSCSSETSGSTRRNDLSTAPPDATGVSGKRRNRRNRRRNRRRHGARNNYPAEASTVKPGSSPSPTTAPTHSRAAFKSSYVEEALLGKGGYGSVFAGYRKHDNLPVAIKHIPSGPGHLDRFMDEKNGIVPLEVALMLKLRSAGGASGVPALLDWYDLRDELILILERPVSCMDLVDYFNFKDCTLQECEVKNIVKQLVDILIEIHTRGVFHRDIKLDNILCETSPGGPRMWIIDFGNGSFLTEGIYITEPGTDLYTSPEWYLHGYYKPEPTTVWQLGVVLYLLLHSDFPFHDTAEIIRNNVRPRCDLSSDCTDLLLSCLNQNPAARPSLETLKHHSWLRSSLPSSSPSPISLSPQNCQSRP